MNISSYRQRLPAITPYSAKLSLALLGLAVTAGVIIALYIDRTRLYSIPAQPLLEERQFIISELTLAALADPAARDKQNPPLKQSKVYRATDLLALQVTTHQAVTSPVQINARLVTQTGAIIEMDPPSITLPPGKSTFCCWQVEQEGEYLLQLFRPEGIISTAPLTIRRGSGAPQFNF
jgi:hypothetical protein